MNDSGNTSDDLFDPPWPEKDDSLVTDCGDRSYLAQTMSSGQWEAFVVAYRKAAEILVERIPEEVIWVNFLVFPIVFLYRHYLELRLKTIIQDGKALDGIARHTDNEHRLLTLWGQCRPIIEQWLVDCPKSDLDSVEDTLKQFENLDSKSQAARYPIDNKAENASNLLNIRINVKKFADTVTKTANFLDCVADEFAELKSNRDKC